MSWDWWHGRKLTRGYSLSALKRWEGWGWRGWGLVEGAGGGVLGAGAEGWGGGASWEGWEAVLKQERANIILFTNTVLYYTLLFTSILCLLWHYQLTHGSCNRSFLQFKLLQALKIRMSQADDLAKGWEERHEEFENFEHRFEVKYSLKYFKYFKY